MKIITENAVYVQRMDLSLIFRMMELDTIPESITLKVFGDETGTMADENSNKEEFVKFESDDEIDFFRNIDWIVDFNQVNNLSIDEIADMRRDTLRKRDRIGKLIYSLPTKEHIVNPKYIYTHMSLGYKAYHLENILWFK